MTPGRIRAAATVVQAGGSNVPSTSAIISAIPEASTNIPCSTGCSSCASRAVST